MESLCVLILSLESTKSCDTTLARNKKIIPSPPLSTPVHAPWTTKAFNSLRKHRSPPSDERCFPFSLSLSLCLSRFYFTLLPPVFTVSFSLLWSRFSFASNSIFTDHRTPRTRSHRASAVSDGKELSAYKWWPGCMNQFSGCWFNRVDQYFRNKRSRSVNWCNVRTLRSVGSLTTAIVEGWVPFSSRRKNRSWKSRLFRTVKLNANTQGICLASVRLLFSLYWHRREKRFFWILVWGRSINVKGEERNLVRKRKWKHSGRFNRSYLAVYSIKNEYKKN